MPVPDINNIPLKCVPLVNLQTCSSRIAIAKDGGREESHYCLDHQLAVHESCNSVCCRGNHNILVSRGRRARMSSFPPEKQGMTPIFRVHFFHRRCDVSCLPQVDVCHLGLIGPKALVGDIPAFLGGVQPASVVANTPLRVLYCRADKFAAQLEQNVRAKKGEATLLMSVVMTSANRLRIEIYR